MRIVQYCPMGSPGPRAFPRRCGAISLLILACMGGPAVFAAGPSAAKPPKFNCNIATLTVGRDGKVYMTSLGPGNEGLVLRLDRDGTERECALIGPILLNATANAQGIMGVDCAHFSKRVMLLDRNFGLLGAMIKVEGFTGASPAHVEAGPSGDFYVLDDAADRIVRCRPDGVRCGTYLIPREPAGPAGQLRDFRVCEKTKTLYVYNQTGTVRCLSFDSPEWKVRCKKLWSIASPVTWGEAHIGGGSGGFDVDEEGTLFVTDKFGETIRRYDVKSTPLAEIRLDLGPNKPAAAERGFRAMSIYGGEVLLKRMSETELFQRYDLRTGKLLNIAAMGEYKQVARPLMPSALPSKPPSGRQAPGRPLRVLFIGNSQINCVCDIPEIVEDLSHSAPAQAPRIETDEVVVGGATIESLWNNALVQKKLQAGVWDWIVCHEIVYSYGGNTARFQQFARKFDPQAKKLGARTLFYATADVETAKGRQKAMYVDALAMARECKTRVAGGGMAWLRAWGKRPQFDFYHTDRAHPNAAGYYLNACVIFAALTDASPVGLDPFKLSKEDAEFLQRTAWEQYLEDRASEK
jgi:hypothetical protein